MWSTAREVAAGDTVIIWLTRDQIQHLVVAPGKDFNTKYGNFRHSDFVGIPYGSKVVPKSGRGFIYLLRPTPELWTLALPHRTQILYLADIAFITSYLGIKKDSKVIEAGMLGCTLHLKLELTSWKGTGSASFSHSVARTIGPTGHLWSYEFHEARFNKAKEEFSRHGMDDRVTLQHRNVCKDGFTVVEQADSVFLDLPAPWDAVDHAKKSLRKDRNTRICCFSPCIEQVLRTVNKLNEAGFTEITTYEILLRPIEVFHTMAPQPVSVVAEKLKASERKREEKRLKQIQANREKQAEQQAKEKKRKRERGQDEIINETLVHDDDADQGLQGEEGTSKKRPRIQEDQEGRPEEEMDAASSSTATIATIPLSKAELSNDPISMPPADPASTSQIPVCLPSSSEAIASCSVSPVLPMPASVSPKPQSPIITKINISKALPEVRGHTSYLTFARLVPISSSSLPSITTPASASVSTQSLESQVAGIGNGPLPAPEQHDQTT